MFSAEKKSELKEMVKKANEILKDYYVSLQYCQFTHDASEGMIPTLVCSMSDIKKAQDRITRISLQIMEEDENNICKLVFYVSGVNYFAKDLNDSIEKMNEFQKTLNDVKALNEIGLWASGDLRTLYS